MENANSPSSDICARRQYINFQINIQFLPKLLKTKIK